MECPKCGYKYHPMDLVCDRCGRNYPPMYQCPYDEATVCAMINPCEGCEQYREDVDA